MPPDTEVDDEVDAEVEDDNDDNEDADEKFDEARARATIKKQRDAEKSARKQVKDLKAQLTKLQNETLPDAEKTRVEREADKARIADLESKMRKSTLRSTAMEEASRLGYRNPTLAARLIDADEVEWDDDSDPLNVAELLKAILKEDPSLKGRRRRTRDDADGEDDEDDDESADAAAGRGRKGKGSQSMNDLIRNKIGR